MPALQMELQPPVMQIMSTANTAVVSRETRDSTITHPGWGPRIEIPGAQTDTP